MSFLYPLFLVGLAALAIPIALHLFRRKTQVVIDFPAVRLLHKAPVEQQRRRRLRELILLALRVAALALLAFAFARPYLPAAVASAPVPVTVVMIDTSLSMTAPGQWDRARELARQAVRDAPATHNVALVAFADGARVVVPPTTDRGGVTGALDQLQPGTGGTRYRTAFARAAESITSGQGAIVVVSDLQQAGWDASDEGAVPEGIDIKVMEVAAPLSNLAVTAVRRDSDAVVAAVHNFGMRAQRATIRLRTVDGESGRDVASQPIDIGAQAAAEVRFTVPLPERGGAEVRIEDNEGFQGDNARYFVLDASTRLPVFVITAEPPDSSNAGLYVERALSVADDGRAFLPRVVEGRAFSALPAAQFTDAAAIILLGTASLDRVGRERISGFLRGGGRVLLTLGPDVDVATLADTVATPIQVADQTAVVAGQAVTLIAADIRHPIFQPFASASGALGDVYVDRYRRLTTQEGQNVLARFSGGADALIERPVERGRLLVFASDLDNRWNRFPLNPAFVPWMIETARYLTQGREQRQTFTLPDVPAGLAGNAGIYPLDGRAVAVNPDVRESNPARMAPTEFVAGITRSGQVAAASAAAAAREQEERQRLWQVGLALMFVALASEGLIGRKAV
jgi:hypothetical protein